MVEPSIGLQSELAAGDSGNTNGVQKSWVLDEEDPEIAVNMASYGDAIPAERRQVYTPTQFQNASYVGSQQMTDPKKRRGPVTRDVLPDKFAGRIPWTDYRRHFDVCRRLNGWNDVDAGQYLATRLQGAALKVLNNIPSGRELTYSELASQLERRFGPGENTENFLLELRTRRQQPRESLQELGQAIRDLTFLAYPELSNDARERLARGHFSDAIDDGEIRAAIFRAHPRTLDEAITAALTTESFLQTEKAREKNRPRHVRAVGDAVHSSPADERVKKEIEELKSSLQEIKSMMKQMSVNRNGGPPRFVCFNCGEPGHISRVCSKPYQGNEGRPSRRTTGRPFQQAGPQN